jgi:hypothetical protein
MADYSVHSSLNALFRPTLEHFLSKYLIDARIYRICLLPRTPVSSGEITEATSGHIGQRRCIPHAQLLGRDTGSWIVLWSTTPSLVARLGPRGNPWAGAEEGSGGHFETSAGNGAGDGSRQRILSH